MCQALGRDSGKAKSRTQAWCQRTYNLVGDKPEMVSARGLSRGSPQRHKEHGGAPALVLASREAEHGVRMKGCLGEWLAGTAAGGGWETRGIT